MNALIAVLVSLMFLAPDLRQLERSFVAVDAEGKLRACKYEVSNKEYRKFLNILRNEGSEVYGNSALELAMYDSLQWEKQFPSSNNRAMMMHYHNNPAYDQYPVLNISWDAANLYCEWLTNWYNSMPRRSFYRVQFRLPRAYEWEYAALDKESPNEYPTSNGRLQDANGRYLANVRFQPATDNPNQVTKTVSYTAPVSSYTANPRGIFHLTGNVAEMTSERGLVKGGDWFSPADYGKVDAQRSVELPSPLVGFRVFMEILEY